MRAVTLSFLGLVTLVLVGCSATEFRRFVSPLPCSAGECEPGVDEVAAKAGAPFAPVPEAPIFPVQPVTEPSNGGTGNIGIGNTGSGNIGINNSGDFNIGIGNTGTGSIGIGLGCDGCGIGG